MTGERAPERPWSPLKTALLTCVLVFVLACAGGGVYAVVADIDPEALAKTVGEPLFPVLILVFIVVYALRRGRLGGKK